MPLVNTPLAQTISATAKRRFLILLSALGVMLVVAIPVSAQARGNVTIEAPVFSIGVHDNHYRSKRHRPNDRYRNRHSYNYERSYRRDRRYYRDRSRRYNNDQYYDNNYYYGRRDRRAQVCPVEGYSPYYNDNLNCYRHKDHFHCS